MPQADIDKLKSTCKCIDPTLTDSQIEALYLPMVQVLAKLTGWGNGECATPYKSLREQIEEYKACNCICDCKDPIKLNHRLVDKNSIQVELYLVNNAGEMKYILQPTAIRFSSIENSIRLDLSEQVFNEFNELVDFTGSCCRCDKYYIKVMYLAGYDELPDCIIDIICWLFNYLNLSKIGADCSLSCCQELDRIGYGARLTERRVGDISFSYEYPESTLFSTLTDPNLAWINRIHDIDNIFFINDKAIW